jgi:hypothetical protein
VRTPRICLLILAAIALAAPLAAQDFRVPKPEKGRITDTVIDANNGVVAGANVVLEGSALRDPRTAVSDDNGFFEFNDVDPGTYNVSVNAKGFANWISPGHFVILTGARLKIADALTTVSVTYSPD